MLLRPGTLPLGSGYSYELKWDGFRALVSTVDGLRVRSRRGWDMTALLPELEEVPPGLVLDGELVAFDDGRPSFPLLSNRVLHRNSDAAVTFVAFDVLFADSAASTAAPLRGTASPVGIATARIAGLCRADLRRWAGALRCGLPRRARGDRRQAPPRSVQAGQAAWVKIKNPGYWRRASEIEAMQKSIERRQRRAVLGR
jgi:hypothetical protein